MNKIISNVLGAVFAVLGILLSIYFGGNLISYYNYYSEKKELQEKVDDIKLSQDIMNKLNDYSTVDSYKKYLIQDKKEKAFAVGSAGQWGSSYYKTNIEAAKKVALQACNKYTKENDDPCQIVDINGEFIANLR